MPDLEDYILHDRPELWEHPAWDRLEVELNVEVLDYADERLREWRATDALADKMADPRWRTWLALPLPAAEATLGTRVVLANNQVATIVGFDRPGLDDLARVSPPPSFEPYSGLVEIRQLRRWVPVPLDAATLGTWSSTAPKMKGEAHER